MRALSLFLSVLVPLGVVADTVTPESLAAQFSLTTRQILRIQLAPTFSR